MRDPTAEILLSAREYRQINKGMKNINSTTAEDIKRAFRTVGRSKVDLSQLFSILISLYLPSSKLVSWPVSYWLYRENDEVANIPSKSKHQITVTSYQCNSQQYNFSEFSNLHTQYTHYVYIM